MAPTPSLFELMMQAQKPIKRSVFISYHHGGDQHYYDAFSKSYHDEYEAIYDNSLERKIDSDDVNYVLQRIRDKFITGTSCTIVLCGANTWKRKYVDWEIKATLDKQHGLIGVQLPSAPVNSQNLVTVPARLEDNIRSGFGIWTNWAEFTASHASVKAFVEQAIAKPVSLIVNNRQMMGRNLS